jgi:hypothetical protein
VGSRGLTISRAAPAKRETQHPPAGIWAAKTRGQSATRPRRPSSRPGEPAGPTHGRRPRRTADGPVLRTRPNCAWFWAGPPAQTQSDPHRARMRDSRDRSAASWPSSPATPATRASRSASPCLSGSVPQGDPQPELPVIYTAPPWTVRDRPQAVPSAGPVVVPDLGITAVAEIGLPLRGSRDDSGYWGTEGTRITGPVAMGVLAG